MLKKILLALSVLAASASAVSAQVSVDKVFQNARDQFSDIKNRSIELERMKREANKQPASRDFTREFPKIKDDFEKIQNLTSELFQLITAEPSLNHAAVLKFVSEINQRAVRLKSNLFTDAKTKKATKTKPPTAEPRDVKTLLLALDSSVDSFVRNSIFQNMNLVNSADSLKAQKDLQTIIEVSGAVKVKTKN